MATSVERSRLLPHPVERVWDVLADFGAISAWTPRIDHSCALDADPAGTGTRRRIQIGRATVVEEVTVWEPPHRLSYRIDGLPSRFGTVTNAWRLRPADGAPAATTATVTTSVESGRRLLERVVARRAAALSDDMLAGLHAHLSHAGAPT